MHSVNEKMQDDTQSTPSTISINSKINQIITSENGADFETAIAATGSGAFNFLMVLVTIPSILAILLEITGMSYVFPMAQCDMNFSLEDKGLINALIYVGMIASAFVWGSLCDIFGRRYVLFISHISNCAFAVMTTFAPNVAVLLVAKFFGGFIMNGPSICLTPYLSEFHGTFHRSRVPLIIGLLYNVGNTIVPLLAWLILPLDQQITLFGFELHAWNIFLSLTFFLTLVSGVSFFFMPESPKYLMTRGKNDEALKVFRQVYKFNTCKPKSSYPITKLIDDRKIFQKSHSLTDGWKQIRPLFSRIYARNLITVCLLQCLLMMGVTSLRLWLPEIFQILNDYEYYNNETSTVCNMLLTTQPTEESQKTCSVNFNNSSVYINSVIVAMSAILGYMAAAVLVNKLGKKKLLVGLGLVAGVSSGAIYFAPNATTAVVLICFHLTSCGICIDTLVILTVDLFPTQLRSSAISLAFMAGRISSVLGNIFFPYLLQLGCAPPFFTLGGVALGCAILSIFLPNTDFKALE